MTKMFIKKLFQENKNRLKYCFFLTLLTLSAQIYSQSVDGSWLLRESRNNAKIVVNKPGVLLYLITWDVTPENDSPEQIKLKIDNSLTSAYIYEGSQSLVEGQNIEIIESANNIESKKGSYRQVFLTEPYKGTFRMNGTANKTLVKLLITKLKYSRNIRVYLGGIEDNIAPASNKNFYNFKLYVDGNVLVDNLGHLRSVDVYGKEVWLELTAKPTNTFPSNYYFKCNGKFLVYN